MSEQKSEWPEGVLSPSHGKYEIRLSTFSKEKMLESVTTDDIVNVLRNAKELRKMKKGELLRFLRKSKVISKMNVESTLPKLQDKDLFQIIADNKELEKKLNIDLVFRVIKRAGRHAAIMRFTRGNMLRLFTEARLKSYLSLEELKHFSSTGRVLRSRSKSGRISSPKSPRNKISPKKISGGKKRVPGSPRSRPASPRFATGAAPKTPSKRGPANDNEKMNLLKGFSHEQLRIILVKYKLTEKLPHGALSKAVKQMTRADALACIGASDLKRILLQQGLMDMIQMSHIISHLKIHKLLRILTRKHLDMVIAEFDLSVNMEKLVEIILSGQQEEADEQPSTNTVKGFDMSTINTLLNGEGSNDVRVVRMEFVRRRSFDNQCVSIYGITQARNPLIPVSDVNSTWKFISSSEEDKGKDTDQKPGERKNAEINPLSNDEVDDQEAQSSILLGAFIWDASRNKLILVARQSDGSHTLLYHTSKSERAGGSDTKWKPPDGFFNDRSHKMSLSVESFDDKRLAREADRCGYIPTAEQWGILQRSTKERIFAILSKPNIIKLISPERLVRVAGPDVVSKLISHKSGISGDLKEIPAGEVKELKSLISEICRQGGETVSELIYRMSKKSALNLLETSNAIDYLHLKQISELKASKTLSIFRESLKSMDKELDFLSALTRAHIAQSVTTMSVCEVLQVLKPSDLSAAVLDYGLAASMDKLALLKKLDKSQLFAILKSVSGTAVATAAFGESGCDTCLVARTLLFGETINFKGDIQKKPIKNEFSRGRHLRMPDASILKFAKVNSSTLLQMTLSDSAKQKGTSFYAAMQPNGILCLADMV
mmetsp:Transcript_9201/g.13807  ORF Transcript_9201/g.13807 Transcript_9201/m.13807 type:complete len:830 (+) Transcript_9201:47-2536(+)